MKRFFIAVLILLTAFNLSGKVRKTMNEVSANDDRITFVGRTLKNETGVSFDWSGVYAKVKFRGSYLAINVSDTQKNYFNVWIDKTTYEVPDKVISTFGKDSLVVLFEVNKRNTKKCQQNVHNLIIQKRTEGCQGTTTIHSVITDGELLQADRLKGRMIEFIGDSYTCGYGSENSIKTDPFTPETENCNFSYAPIIARYFDTDYILIAHSGMGISRNYNDVDKGNYMPDKYLQTLDMDKNILWNVNKNEFKPDITIIYLGTNDFSTGRQPTLQNFKRNYIRLLKEIKSNYGDSHPILCVGSKIDEMMYYYLQDIERTCGLKNVSFMVFTEKIHNIDSELGASWHPNHKGHIKKAYALIPYISTITSWEMTEKHVK